MTQSTYQQQVRRLQSNWGEHQYKAERVSLFWKAFEQVSDQVFVAAVDILIAEQRSPPMLKEISQAVEQAKLTANSGRMGGNAFANVLGDLVETNKTASPELVQAKLELFRRRYCEKDPAKRYTAEQFHQGLDYFESLDRKFSPRTRTGTVSDARTRAAEGSKHHE